jgi:CheY-like chemotaxis protein
MVERIAPDLWPLDADPTQIHQVLTNLCVNARDAMPAGGSITITAENVRFGEHDAAGNIDAGVGPYVKVEVTDTGTGIPKEIIDQIFDPFFTTKDVGKGTGLGLATSRAIVKGHGGFIRAYSDPRAGTRICVFLPAQTVALPRAPAAAARERRTGNGETVLVVDDEGFIRRLAKRTLEAHGYYVLLAADGVEATALYKEHQSDISVVLTDMMMPVMDGAATIQELVRLNPDVRIIGASGLAGDQQVTAVGGINYKLVSKPYSADTLLTAIKAALA